MFPLVISKALIRGLASRDSNILAFYVLKLKWLTLTYYDIEELLSQDRQEV
jgi:hypothetical protein